MSATAIAASGGPSSTEPTTVQKLRGLRWSHISNAANTVFAHFTFFGSTFVLFLSALGMDKAQIGFMLSLIPFAGLIALFVAPFAARYGYKRTFVTFFALRKLVTLGLLFTPAVAAGLGAGALTAYVALVTAGFSVAKAISETGYFPWFQEFVPSAVRGTYSAMSNIYIVLVGLVSVTVAGFVLERSNALSSYMVLIAVGVLFGGVSAWAASRIPGGAPVRDQGQRESLRRGIPDALRDRNYVRYMAGVGLVTLATVPVVSFVPLFMQEEVDLNAGQVVLLQTGMLFGMLFTSLPWGWAADRYGSRPVMLLGLALKALLPVMWLAMPRQSANSLYIALGIALVLGISEVAWLIGAPRLFFGSVVPPEKKMVYLSLHYSLLGFVGGASQLLGGWLLTASALFAGTYAGVAVTSYTPLFVLGFLLVLASVYVLWPMRADNVYGVAQFAGMFFRGNPAMALATIVRYPSARRETSAIVTTERLGRAKSPLVVNELLNVIQDPRHNVRMEAIVAMARMPSDPRLIDALSEILDSTQPSLQTMAAWALGRMGDPRAEPALRKGMESPYHSVRAHSVRALGALKIEATTDEMLARLQVEDDKGLMMAYASALGKLRAVNATPALMGLWERVLNPGARRELALDVARILGEEGHFIKLWRGFRRNVGLAAAQSIDRSQRQLSRRSGKREPVRGLEQACQSFHNEDLEAGVLHLAHSLEGLLAQGQDETTAMVLRSTAERLHKAGPADEANLLLALHALHIVSRR
jgi:MFS family permease